MSLTSVWLNGWLGVSLTFLINTAKHIMRVTFSEIKTFETATFETRGAGIYGEYLYLFVFLSLQFNVILCY